MISISSTNLNNIYVDDYWNFSETSESLMHNIHAYPAKFPSFIASKAFSYAQEEGVEVESVADVFCGCGTVALEAKLHNKCFWGCDINPVATLIAEAKSRTYKIEILEKYFEKIRASNSKLEISQNLYILSNERIQYWFTENSFVTLYRLYQSIEKEVPEGKYRDAFLCLFSSILKASSKWLTKSIKPQIDPVKKEIDIFRVFSLQYQKFFRAVDEIQYDDEFNKKIEIHNWNFLEMNDLPKVDLIISSPPYVTSYEYADLHQLSTLWLGFADDYRDLRKGSIGSVYNCEDFNLQIESLNRVGQKIVQEMVKNKNPMAKIRSVGRYYLDMQKAIHKCAGMLKNRGMVFFVVGDTEYKGVKIKNSEHLIQSLIDEGFSDIKVAKRRVSNKLLTPYRDSIGRFSSDKTQRKIYHEEFILSGRIW